MTHFPDRHFWHGGYDKAGLVVIALRSAVAVSSVSAVHEQVHQRTSEEEQPGQIGKGEREMGAVLGDQEICADRKEAQQHHAAASLPPGCGDRLFHRMMLGIIIHRYDVQTVAL